MEILDIGNKYLLKVLPEIVSKELNETICDIKFIGGGSFGRVFKTKLGSGRIIAIKAYRVQGSQYKEAAQLRILADGTSVKMPEVVFTYEDEKTAILGMTFVGGKNVLESEFLLKSKKKKQKFASDVVDGMLEWHSITSEKFGEIEKPVYALWTEYYKKEKQVPWLKALSELADNGKYSKKDLALLKEATEIFNTLPENNATPSLIHGDLNIMNIMADSDLNLTAFIDPCGSIWADREYDLFQLRNMWGDAFGLYETYKSKCELPEYADFRIAYYASMHEASMRLKGGLTMPLWEILNNRRLKKEIKKLKMVKSYNKDEK